MEAISLDGIDTTVAWRVDAERPIMESAPDWLEQEVVEGVEEEEEVTPPTPVTSKERGLPPITPSFSTSRARQSPLLAPPPSSSRGKVVTFSHKRGRENQ